MSCLATLYVLPESQRAAFLSSPDRKPRLEEKKILFFRVRKPVAGEHIWQFLNRAMVRMTDLEVSGFLVSDYLFLYFQIGDAGYFEEVDAHCSALFPDGARKLAAFLGAGPADRVAIGNYLRLDGRPLAGAEREKVLAAYEHAHVRLLAWARSIQEEEFGVLYLSF